MSAGAIIEAIGVIADLTTAAAMLSGEARRVADLIEKNGGSLTDEQWAQMQHERARLLAGLAKAISDRAVREGIASPLQGAGSPFPGPMTGPTVRSTWSSGTGDSRG